MIKTISVLDTNYIVHIGKREDIGISKENEGECRIYSKEILVYHDDLDGLSEEERKVKTSEIIAHELLHAYFNEAGIELDESTEELLCTFYMKNWRKLNNNILGLLEVMDILDI